MRRADQLGLMLAAHGERRSGAENDGVARLAAALAARDTATEVGFGFLNGAPMIGDAVAAFDASDILVYPLFLSDGYFTRVRLAQALADANSDGARAISMLPPLGLDPALASLIADKATDAALAEEFALPRTSVVLLAHGSSKDPASQTATDVIAQRLDRLRWFAGVKTAFLDQHPSLAAACARIAGPIVVVGLFAGEGLHGRQDVPRLVAALDRPDTAFAGNVGAWPEIADIVLGAIRRRPAEGEASRTAGADPADVTRPSLAAEPA